MFRLQTQKVILAKIYSVRCDNTKSDLSIFTRLTTLSTPGVNVEYVELE